MGRPRWDPTLTDEEHVRAVLPRSRRRGGDRVVTLGYVLISRSSLVVLAAGPRWLGCGRGNRQRLCGQAILGAPRGPIQQAVCGSRKGRVVTAIQPELAVVVPARNEEGRIGACLSSLTRQSARIQVFVSDNASEDRTGQRAAEFEDRLRLTTRRTEFLEATEHFVSAARWALTNSEAPLFALLAGDDSWEATFVQQALSAFEQCPSAAVAYPTFIWEGGDRRRVIPPANLMGTYNRQRQARALFLPDSRELANLVYGVYRRDAFESLIQTWQRGGDRFGSDYAAAWNLLERYRVVAAPSAVAYRYERGGGDLIERAGITRTGSEGLMHQALLYVRLNVRVNADLARALVRGRGGGPRWLPALVQGARTPGWVWRALDQVRTRSGGERS